MWHREYRVNLRFANHIERKSMRYDLIDTKNKFLNIKYEDIKVDADCMLSIQDEEFELLVYSCINISIHDSLAAFQKKKLLSIEMPDVEGQTIIDIDGNEHALITRKHAYELNKEESLVWRLDASSKLRSEIEKRLESHCYQEKMNEALELVRKLPFKDVIILKDYNSSDDGEIEAISINGEKIYYIYVWAP